MDKLIIVVPVALLALVIFGFAVNDLIKGIWSKKMSYIQPGGVYQMHTTNTTSMTNMKVDTLHSETALTVNGQGLVWRKPNGTHVDISKAAEIFWFFLAQHPEIVEQFNAIEKIKES